MRRKVTKDSSPQAGSSSCALLGMFLLTLPGIGKGYLAKLFDKTIIGVNDWDQLLNKVDRRLCGMRDKQSSIVRQAISECDLKVSEINDKLKQGNWIVQYTQDRVLVTKGKVEGPKIGVVGTRRMSDYGRKIVENICPMLAQNGATLVTGMADGIDAHSYKTMLKFKGNTIAVMPYDFDAIPEQVANLIDKGIATGGACITEYHGGKGISKGAFLDRNKVLVDVCDCVVVVEAPRISGAIHTANCAIKTGKKVYVFPGNIFAKTSEGCNELCRRIGVTCLDSIETFGRDVLGQREALFKRKKLQRIEARIVKLCENGAMQVDDMSQILSCDIVKLRGILTMMELKGIVRLSILSEITVK